MITIDAAETEICGLNASMGQATKTLKLTFGRISLPGKHVCLSAPVCNTKLHLSKLRIRYYTAVCDK